MLQYDPKWHWPTAEDLLGPDDAPVDSELQDLIPGLLKAVLAWVWANRMDWFFGVYMGVYYDLKEPPIVPDGFLSLGVERFIDEDELRFSYVIWEEKQVPIFALEIISGTYRGEFSTKKEKYAEIGILYYAVYNPRRRRKAPLEVYRLVNGAYELLPGNPVWLPEINLGIGREEGTYQGLTREWLYWYDSQGQRFLTPEERALQEQQLRLQAEQRAHRLAERLRELGVDPDSLA